MKEPQLREDIANNYRPNIITADELVGVPYLLERSGNVRIELPLPDGRRSVVYRKELDGSVRRYVLPRIDITGAFVGEELIGDSTPQEEITIIPSETAREDDGFAAFRAQYPAKPLAEVRDMFYNRGGLTEDQERQAGVRAQEQADRRSADIAAKFRRDQEESWDKKDFETERDIILKAMKTLDDEWKAKQNKSAEDLAKYRETRRNLGLRLIRLANEEP